MATYHLRDTEGRVSGPFTDEDLRRLAREGRLERRVEISRDGSGFRPLGTKMAAAGPLPWFRLDMAMRPTWEHVSLIRDALDAYLGTVFADADYRFSLTTVVSELVESMIKFGDWERFPAALVKLKVQSDAKSGAMLEVSGPCTPSSPQAREIMAAVADLGVNSAAQLYQRRLLQIAQRPDAGEDHVLPLLRVAFEAGCPLTAAIDADNSLRITALLAPPTEPRAESQAVLVRPALPQ
jgi:hypothetical protein